MIRERYPDIVIQGGNYPPPAIRQYIAQALGSLKLVLILLVVAGQNPFTFFNMQTPAIYTWALENKIYASLITFFVSNAIETQLISTGAFEVALNDVPIWSKLETGRAPSAGELMQIIDNHMKMNNGS